LSGLGFGDGDRVAIVHADDLGMCQSTLTAFADLMEAGLVSSAAVMVPCPWFPEAAAYCRAHPELDVGVHLTLTCEWDSYRWGPVFTRDPASGLLDEEGYMHRTSQAVWAHASVPAVEAESGTQLDRALAAGLDVTHVDTHMATLAHPRFVEGYAGLALDRGLPMAMLRPDGAAARARGVEPRLARQLARRLAAARAPVFDAVAGLPLDDPRDRVAQARRLFDTVRPGLSLVILHAACDTPELRAIASDWPSRVADYEAFTSRELRDHVRSSGVQVIGYRALRDEMRAAASR
jgi:predicted glycoside hydrolase/deacetylase ChbG (UPF0249 family)